MAQPRPQLARLPLIAIALTLLILLLWGYSYLHPYVRTTEDGLRTFMSASGHLVFVNRSSRGISFEDAGTLAANWRAFGVIDYLHYKPIPAGDIRYFGISYAIPFIVWLLFCVFRWRARRVRRGFDVVAPDTMSK